MVYYFKMNVILSKKFGFIYKSGLFLTIKEIFYTNPV